MEDTAIVALFLAREERAIRETERSHGAFLRALAGRFVPGPDAEECVSDAYLRAWNAIPPERPGNLRAYLAKITRNLAIDRLRRENSQSRGGEARAVIAELEAALPDNAFDAVSARELGSYVNRFVRSLPERDGDILIRRCFYAEPVRDIAKRYGMTPNAVSVSLSRSRRKLAEYLRKEGLL